METEEFVTGDLYLSAAIISLLDINPSFKTEKNLVLFVFPVSTDLYKAVNSYYNGISINAYGYAQTIKKLRTEMIIRKNKVLGE